MTKFLFIILTGIISVPLFSQNVSFYKMGNNDVGQQDSVFRSFMFDLDAKNFDKARFSLAPKTSRMVDDTRMNQLRDQFTGKDSLIIFMSGPMTSKDGGMLTVLQYKYITDTSGVPAYMLKVEINDQNKIVFIQPVERTLIKFSNK